MKTVTKEELAAIVASHALWVSSGTREGQRAYLSYANLSGANLRGADLSGADLSGAYLSYANLSGAYLRGAYLSGAYLSGAYLSGADLSYADLSGADLSYADLSGADLRGADLPAFSHCPEEGEFVAFKKIHRGVIAKLLIPANAGRTSSLVGRKCRAEFAVVMQLSVDGKPLTEGVSNHNPSTKYVVGETVYPDSYDPDIRVECTNGIHFFITRAEAEKY